MNETSTRRPVKVNGYSHSLLDAKKSARRSEAETRTEEYRALSRDEKLSRVYARRGNSKRELARLGVK